MIFTLSGIQLTHTTQLQQDLLLWVRDRDQNSLTPSPMPRTISMARRSAMIKWAISTTVACKKEQGYS